MIVHVICLNSEDVNCNLLYLGLTAEKVLDDVKEDILPRIEESNESDALKCVESIEGLKEWFSEHFAFYEVKYFTRDVQ